MGLIGSGWSNQENVDQLALSLKMVRSYVSSILSKLQVADRERKAGLGSWAARAQRAVCIVRYPDAEDTFMKVKAVIHKVSESEGSGYWAEVPALPGCMTQGETYDDLLRSIHEAIEGWLSIETEPHAGDASAEVVEIAV